MENQDVFELVVKGTVDGETADNVYFFIGDNVDIGGLPLPTDEEDTRYCLQQLADVLYDQLLNEASNSFSPLLVWNGWKARNLFDPVSMWADTFTNPALFDGATALIAPFATYSLYSPTKRRGQNGAHKGLAGCIEGSVTDGTLVSGTVDQLQNWLDATLNIPIETGLALSYGVRWRCVNVKRIFVPGTLTHDPYYRLPETGGEYAGYIADNWTVQVNLSTRNSRKRGRGT